MLLLLLLVIPITGIFVISTGMSYDLSDLSLNKRIKFTALTTSIINLFISFIIFIAFDFSSNQFQFVQEYHQISSFDFYLGIDGLSVYFVLLTTIVIPISLLSNWTSISKKENIRSYVIIILLLETLLLAVFLVLDILLFYIFFESILPPLFILIGLFGSSNRVRASFYLFLYTLLGSLFLLLSIVTMSSIMGTTDFDALYKTNFNYLTQLFLFYGIFIAFAVKTPTIFLNTWLLKAHVESPLGGSIILAGILMLALNLAKCWKHLISCFRSISRKLYALLFLLREFFISKFKDIFWGDIFLNLNIIINLNYDLNYDIKLDSIFRGHTLKVINTKNIHDKSNLNCKQYSKIENNNINFNKENYNNNNLNSYLAGLIEGDGSIYIPKKNKNASMITIAFNSKDLPLILTINKTLKIGNIYKIKGKNAYSYTISDIKGLVKLVNLINGFMRTPKVVQLYKLIDLLNNKNNYNIYKLPLDNSLIDSNAWLSGFLEADGCFFIRITQNKHCSTNTKKIACLLELAQKTTNLNNDELLSIMTLISDFLLIKLKIRTKTKFYIYWIRTTSLQSNIALNNYLNKYPLFSSKYLDYLAWKKTFNFMEKKEHGKNLDKIIKLKNSMNSKRIYFNWNHLNNFYSFYE